jgi:3-hydroxyisobutyrate dehydrogenase-like beta-hydroxyacid dehydrogenase
MKVGFVGVGNMGGPMCRNIIKNTNHEVAIFDLNAEAVAACAGAKAGRSLAEVASQSEVIFTSLPMPRDVEAVATGPGGIADHASPGTTYIDLSTNSPAVARKLHAAMQAKGIGMLEAPVSGGVPRAIDGTIVIMVGGDAALFEAQRPLLASFSAEVVHVGDVGYGSVAKLINNQLSFSNMAAAAEALMLGLLSGINLEKLDQVIRNASGNSNSYRNVAAKAFKRDFRPGFALDLAHKDLRLALEMADELGMPGMIGPQVMNLLRMARGMGLGSDDNSSMLKVYEAALGREVKP